TVSAGRLTELLGQFAEQILTRQVASRLRDLVRQGFGMAEVLKERDDVRERLVKRERRGVGRLHVVRVNTVQNRVCRLVGDDVLREAREDHATRKIAPRI